MEEITKKIKHQVFGEGNNRQGNMNRKVIKTILMILKSITKLIIFDDYFNVQRKNRRLFNLLRMTRIDGRRLRYLYYFNINDSNK
jgi:hypothetical protein